MKMLRVKQCCCGCTVRTGSLIIGILCGIFALLEFIYEITSIVSASVVTGDHAHAEEHEGDNSVTPSPTPAVIIMAVLSALLFAACVSLIYGILKERPVFILVWTIVFIVYLVLVVLYITQVAMVLLITTGLWEMPALLFVLAICSYLIVVVNSHYLSLKDGVTMPPRPPLSNTV